MPATYFMYVEAENTAYEFNNGFSERAADFMAGVRDRLGIDGSGVKSFSSSDRDYAASRLHAYVRGRDIGPTIIKVDA